MSKKRFFWEAVLFCFLWVVLFLSFSLVIFKTTEQNTDSELASSLKVAESIFKGSDPDATGATVAKDFESTDPRDVRISIIEKTDTGYTILYDSQGLTKADEKASELNPENLEKPVTRLSSYGYNMIYLAAKDKENPVYYVRAAVRESIALEISRSFLIYGSVTLVLLMGFYIGYKVYQYKKSLKPLSDEITRLSYLAGESTEAKPAGDDLTVLTSSVDVISDELDKKIRDLESEKEKTKMILDSISQGFLAIGGDGNIALFNRAAGAIFKLSESDAMNKDYHILGMGSDFNGKVETALEDKKDIPAFDLSLSGRTYEVNLMALSYPWIENARSGVAVLLWDVTEERNIRKIKTDFFANASHELKSPLTSIIGYQEMIEDGILTADEDRKEAVEKTIQEAKRMKDILSDMLSLNRLENETSPHREQVNLGVLLPSLMEGLKPQAEKRKLTVCLKSEDYFVSADPADMEKLFLNLLDNAVKYNKEGGSITVTMNAKEHSVSVKDTGIGIQEANLSRIFERFYRVDNSRGEGNVEGTGLGLAIVKHICSLYGFSVEVRSVFGEGSEFIVRT
jgi:two-component system phosphate regulon sensor histidine kinase PhoR